MDSYSFYGKRNSEVDRNESLSETDILSSESDISIDNSSDLYEPSSSGNDLTEGSSSPSSDDSSDEEMDGGAQSSKSTTWGHCTLHPPRFGFVGPKEPQVNITESDPYAIYKNFLQMRSFNWLLMKLTGMLINSHQRINCAGVH